MQKSIPMYVPSRAVLAVAGFLLLFAGCEGEEKAEQLEIEVAPEQWVTIVRTSRADEESGLDRGRDRLVVEWKGEEVVWESVCLPKCLREWKGQLFIVGFNRTDLHRCRFQYFRQKGTGFEEIQPQEFPKQIASENICISTHPFMGKSGDKKHTDLELTRDMDVENDSFHGTMTAQIWRHLEKGDDYYQQQSGSDKETVREYKRKYLPIALPNIVRTPKIAKRVSQISAPSPKGVSERPQELVPDTSEEERKSPAIKISLHGLERMNVDASIVGGKWVIDHGRYAEEWICASRLVPIAALTIRGKEAVAEGKPDKDDVAAFSEIARKAFEPATGKEPAELIAGLIRQAQDRGGVAVDQIGKFNTLVMIRAEEDTRTPKCTITIAWRATIAPNDPEVEMHRRWVERRRLLREQRSAPRAVPPAPKQP